VRAPVPRWERRPSTTIKEYDETVGVGIGELFMEKGTEHRVLSGGRGIIRRVEDEPGWAIELDTLDDLLAFERLHGQIILTSQAVPSEPDVGRLEIEIDDYRPVT